MNGVASLRTQSIPHSVLRSPGWACRWVGRVSAPGV